MSVAGKPITVGPTPVPVYCPSKSNSVALAQTAGTSVAFTVMATNGIVIGETAAGGTFTFTPPPGTYFNPSEPLGFVQIKVGTATFLATAA